MQDIEKHCDFARYFDNTLKSNVWVLGYLGGGDVNVFKAYEVAKLFSEKVNVPIETIHISIIENSRRFKRFKYIFSIEENQTPEKESRILENVLDWLFD